MPRGGRPDIVYYAAVNSSGVLRGPTKKITPEDLMAELGWQHKELFDLQWETISKAYKNVPDERLAQAPTYISNIGHLAPDPPLARTATEIADVITRPGGGDTIFNRDILAPKITWGIDIYNKPKQEETKMQELKNPIERKTYVNGRDIAGLSDIQLMDQATQLKERIESLETSDFKSARVDAHIVELKHAMRFVVKTLDERGKDLGEAA